MSSERPAQEGIGTRVVPHPWSGRPDGVRTGPIPSFVEVLSPEAGAQAGARAGAGCWSSAGGGVSPRVHAAT